MEDKFVDLRDCLFQLNISNIINQMIKICEEINNEI